MEVARGDKCVKIDVGSIFYLKTIASLAVVSKLQRKRITTMDMRFILVRFFDGIIHIVNSKQIRKNKSFLSAKYSDGYYYKCNIIFENGKYFPGCKRQFKKV